jgi:hypothetical protein
MYTALIVVVLVVLIYWFTCDCSSRIISAGADSQVKSAAPESALAETAPPVAGVIAEKAETGTPLQLYDLDADYVIKFGGLSRELVGASKCRVATRGSVPVLADGAFDRDGDDFDTSYCKPGCQQGYQQGYIRGCQSGRQSGSGYRGCGASAALLLRQSAKTESGSLDGGATDLIPASGLAALHGAGDAEDNEYIGFNGIIYKEHMSDIDMM